MIELNAEVVVDGDKRGKVEFIDTMSLPDVGYLVLLDNGTAGWFSETRVERYGQISFQSMYGQGPPPEGERTT